MRKLPAIMWIGLLLAAGTPGGRVTAAEILRMGGTGTAAGMLREVGAQFAADANLEINIVAGLGSGGAIRALTDGKIDVAVSARPLSAEEAASGITQVAVLRTAYVLATSRRNPDTLKSADLPRIYAGQKMAWADGTPIRIILRPRSETDSELLAGMFPGMREALETARRRIDVPVAATDQDNVDLAEQMPGSLTGTTTTQLETERPGLRVVPIDGLEPTLANVESGAYPLVKYLFVLVRSSGDVQGRRFADFLQSAQGTKLLRAAQIAPVAK